MHCADTQIRDTEKGPWWRLSWERTGGRAGLRSVSRARLSDIPTVKRVMMGEGGGWVGDTRAYKCHIAAVIFLSGPVVVILAFLSLLCYAKEGRWSPRAKHAQNMRLIGLTKHTHTHTHTHTHMHTTVTLFDNYDWKSWTQTTSDRDIPEQLWMLPIYQG